MRASRMPLSLCQLTTALSDGGIEERMARVLAELDRAEIAPTWLAFRAADGAPPNRALLERAGGAIPHALIRRGRPGLDPKLVREVAKHLRTFRPDILHVHNWSTSLYGILGARLARVPAVVYGVGGKEHAAGPTDRQRKVACTLAPLVDRFTTVCGFLADELSDTWGVPREDVVVIPTGIGLVEHGPEARAEARRALGLPEDAIVVGTTGADRPVKRLPDLFEACARAAAEDPRVHVLWIGAADGCGLLRGDQSSDLLEIARAAGVAERCHAVGRRDDAARLAAAFDVFLNASEFEGTSNAILEAMAAGATVVATAVGGTPELLEHGAAGRLVPPRNVDALAAATARLVADPAARARLGEAGRRRVLARHTNAAMGAAYRDLYLEALEHRRGAARKLLSSAAAALRAVAHRSPG